ncbi:ABC transporter permease [Mesorhizobium sp. B3-1-3]|uniref:ABC transporter permease n=1 Tax=unclassified Mesorhizobium TaxID=325217 RepID=UPI001129F5F4|nr:MULTISPECIES: ABC transporter permease [unclassified Mesorhizobium]TPI57345.1 ABC transporter permease [Mesorhizobium sp. B3-1-8]TPI63498.1 ABC transporter permease [Mesorhizobium sp. B3-1-3]
MQEVFRRYGVPAAGLMIGLTFFWIVILVVVPYLFLVEASFRPFLPADQVGGPLDHYTLANYLAFVDPNATKDFLIFHVPIHAYVFLQTVFISILVTIVTLMLGYPMAYIMAKIINPKRVMTLFLLLLIPLWVSELLRTFAWYIILAYQGPLNAVLQMFGAAPVRWISGYNGVIIGLIYAYFLFMLFPIYGSLTTLDGNQIEAAQDMGARWWQIHRRVVIPHAKPGIASGCVMVFMMSAGALFVPRLLASTTSRWFTEVIMQWFFEGLDWNTGSAYAFLLLLICTAFVSAMIRIFGVKLADIAR